MPLGISHNGLPSSRPWSQRYVVSDKPPSFMRGCLTHALLSVVAIWSQQTQLLQRCTTILQEAQHPIFLAGFPEELEILAPALKQAQQRSLPIEVISFGLPPAAVPSAIEHFAADDIRSAQQGRLLLLATFPHGMIGFLSEEAMKTAGIWAWNRYLATVIGLYIAHERFTLQLWPRLSVPLRQELMTNLTDLSSRIALAGLSPHQPLRHLLEGTLTPSFDIPPLEE